MTTDHVIIGEQELRDPLPSGDYLRAYCHIHGSDHQRSLEIQRVEGEYQGFGKCYACQTKVLVREMNPAAAERIEAARGQSGIAPAVRVTPSKWVVAKPEVEKWKQEEHAILRALHTRMRRALSWSKLAANYLAGRGIPTSIALSAEVGYLSSASTSDPILLGDPTLRQYVPRLYRWTNRIVFPLVKWSSGGTTRGYIGRTLRLWRPGMDEEQHKAALAAYDQQVEAGKVKYPIHRWLKTDPAGWWYDPAQVGTCVVLVEGGFDKLALLTVKTLLSSRGMAVSLPASNVIALAGTAASTALLPPQVQAIVLALDGDKGGLDSIQRLQDSLASDGKRVYPCPPPADGRGKDWSARWMDGLRHPGMKARLTVLSQATLQPFLASLTSCEAQAVAAGVQPVFEKYLSASRDLVAR